MTEEKKFPKAKVARGNKRNAHSKLDDITIAWMLYDPENGYGIKNPSAPITRLMEARDHSRQQVLIDEKLSPPNIQSEGMWRTVSYQDSLAATAHWDSFVGLPPMYGQFGPRAGRKQRMREAIAKL